MRRRAVWLSLPKPFETTHVKLPASSRLAFLITIADRSSLLVMLAPVPSTSRPSFSHLKARGGLPEARQVALALSPAFS